MEIKLRYYHGTTHEKYDGFNSSPDNRLIGCASSDLEVAKRYAGKCGIVLVFEDHINMPVFWWIVYSFNKFIIKLIIGQNEYLCGLYQEYMGNLSFGVIENCLEIRLEGHYVKDIIEVIEL